MNPDRPSSPRTLIVSAGLIATAAVIWLLKGASVVFLPLAGAVFIVMLVRPLVLWLRRGPSPISFIGRGRRSLVVIFMRAKESS